MIWILHEQAQKFVFYQRQVNRLAVFPDKPFSGIYTNTICLKIASAFENCRERRRSALILESSSLSLKGLCDIIVAAHVKALHNADLLIGRS